MSAGPFLQTFYQADSGDIHIIRVQPETAGADFDGTVNTPPAGPATSPFWAKVSKGRTEYGLAPRFVNIKWGATPPAGYSPNETLQIACLTPAAFAAATLNSTVTYLGAAATVAGKTSENLYPGI